VLIVYFNNISGLVIKFYIVGMMNSMVLLLVIVEGKVEVLVVVVFFSCGFLLSSGGGLFKLDVMVSGVGVVVVVFLDNHVDNLYDVEFGMFMVALYIVGLVVLLLSKYFGWLLMWVKLVLMIGVKIWDNEGNLILIGMVNVIFFDMGNGEVILKWLFDI